MSLCSNAGGCEANRTGVATNAGDAVAEKRLGGTRPESGGKQAHQSHSSSIVRRSSSTMSYGVLVGECMTDLVGD